MNIKHDYQLENTPPVHFNLTKSQKIYISIRRFIELIISIFLLVILSPVLITVAILIKVESPGPILFKQKRIGLRGNEFTIYKFRSMYLDTPIKAANNFKNSKTHTTKIGKIIRKTSVDELPQLINVIKGDMSLIGPRPVISIETELIDLRKAYGVENIPPGLTGLAQVNGRTKLTDKEKADFDRTYLTKVSPIYDIYILCKTVIHLLFGGKF